MQAFTGKLFPGVFAQLRKAFRVADESEVRRQRSSVVEEMRVKDRVRKREANITK